MFTWLNAIVFIVGPVVAYFLGAIPFAYLIGKAKGVDIRQLSSRNVGATNLGRVLGARYFWYAFVLDCSKGLLPVLAISLIAWQNSLPIWAPLPTAVAGVVGHMFPIYLGFKGGKGVAIGLGVALGCWPIFTLAGVGAGLIFVLTLVIFRYISVASMVAAVAFSLFVYTISRSVNPAIQKAVANGQGIPLIVVAALFAVLIIWKHKANIDRLMAGREPKVGQRHATEPPTDQPS